MLGGAILNHGAVLIRRFATARVAKGLRDAIDAALIAEADPESVQAAEGWYEPFDGGPGDADLAVGRALTSRLGGGLLAVDSPRAFFLFADLIDTTGFTAVVREYLGEQPVLSANKTTFRRLRDAPRPAWHQDGSFMGDVRTVNLWISLSHCGGETDTRGLDVIPSRIEELLATGTDGADADVVAIGESLVERRMPAATLTPEFQPGDALCFDERFLHRTSAKGGSGVRHAIEAWFFAPSHFPDQYGAIAILTSPAKMVLDGRVLRGSTALSVASSRRWADHASRSAPDPIRPLARRRRPYRAVDTGQADQPRSTTTSRAGGQHGSQFGRDRRNCGRARVARVRHSSSHRAGSLALDTRAEVWAMSATVPAGGGPSEVSLIIEGRDVGSHENPIRSWSRTLATELLACPATPRRPSRTPRGRRSSGSER